MRFTLTIDCDNAAFEDNPRELSRIIDFAAQRSEEMQPGDIVPLRDYNGNNVGSMELRD